MAMGREGQGVHFVVHKAHIDTCTAHYELRALDAGYALALGNALRRVLLSSLPGAAIISVRIQEAQHEFQDIAEVLEDVTEIVFSLKQVRLRCYSDHPVKMHLDVQGPGEVTAGALRTPETVEIVNPELHLATLDNEKAHLVMELVVSTGRGFVSADEQASRLTEVLPIGVILTDAIYSPIVKAHFSIEPLYQGRRDQTVSIHLEITTDGTISPDEALRQSAAILEQQFGVFADYQPQDEADVGKRPHSSDVLIPVHIFHRSLDDLHLSPRSANVLRRHGITTVGQILEMDREELMSIRNFGERTMQDIMECFMQQHYFPEISKTEQVSS